MINEDKTYLCIFHSDLDGIVSYLTLCWVYDKKIPFIATTPTKLKEDVIKYQEQIDKSDKVYILDLDVTKIGPLIDKKHVVILDHHKTNIYPFKFALTRIYNETSCSKLVFDTFFKSSDKHLSNSRKTLIALADDWDSNRHETPISENLNIVYHSLSNKVKSFIEDYYNGFQQFDKFKDNMIVLYKKQRDSYLANLLPYIGEINYNGKLIRVGAVFCEKFVHESCQYLNNNYDVDISIAVMLSQNRIAVRRHPSNNQIDISEFVQTIASGGGHEAAAGGYITNEFQEFTKLLHPVKKVENT